MTFRPLARILTDGLPDDSVVAWRGDTALRFRQLRAAVSALAATAHAGQRVGLLCRDSFHFAAAFLAMAHAGTEIILPPGDHPATLTALSGAFDRLIDDEAVSAATGGAPLSPVDAERVLITFFTSGSTGQPKRVTRTLAMVQHEVATLEAAFGPLSASSRVLGTVGHHHLYGLTFRLLWPLASGRPFTTATHELWETLFAAAPGNSTIVSSPAHVSRLGGFALLSPADRPGILFCAGAPLSLAASDATAAIVGVRPTEIFGSTESGAIATRQQVEGDEPWQLLPGVRCRISTDGLASFCSPQVAGWMETGDLAREEHGGIRFLGRADGIVKIEGKRVSLPEVEAALTSLPWVADAAALLLPEAPVRLAAVVVPSTVGWKALEKAGHFRFGTALARGVAAKLESAGRPKRWRFVTQLPQRHMGKRDGAALLALFNRSSS